MVRVKNNKIDADTWCGMEIQPSEYYELQTTELYIWQNNSKVLVDIASGDLIVNNNTSDIIDVATAINHLKNIDTKEVDLDGRQIIRTAAGKAGWSYLAHPIEFQTAKFGSVYEKNSSGNDRGFSSVKFYNADNEEVTDSANESTVTKTVLLIKPSYDYELVSGSIQQVQAPTSDLRIWVIGGIVEFGGAYVKEFAGGLNMAYYGANEAVKTDGRAAKYMKKDIAGVPYQANQLQVIVKHDAGHQHKLMLTLEYFRA